MIYRVNSCLLPKQSAPIPDSLDRVGPMGIGARGRILVADDNPSVRRLLSVTLHLHGFASEAVADGDLAMDRMHAGAPDLLITDLMMQRVTGDELARQVWANDPAFPVLFISGCYPQDVKDLVATHKNALFLLKPFTPDQLAAAVEGLLAKRRSGVV